MSISSDTLRGHTDTIILTQLMRGDNYGYEINKTIRQRTGGQYDTDEGRRRWEENCRDWQTTRALLDALISLEDE